MSEPLASLLMRFGRTQKELGKLLGSRSRASELITAQRYMTKAQIAIIHETWGLPIESLFLASLEPKE